MEEFDLKYLTVFKLMNGEVIICEVVEDKELAIRVRYAIRAIEIITLEGEETRFVQWIPFTDDLIILYKQGILASAPPSEDMKEMYLNKMAELNSTETSPIKEEIEASPIQ